ncbi:hypothetical protein NDU88_011508 [Pleurodeles waltl]|uniref:Uncharacterized protein n=1 Tax=Pleurodeles waltl TaxID=8319 RepID=A0AAV7Q0Y1_PLEWA|nr:hypothetical protein NDU88_011508 [Pleurodeles waltl]
MVSRAALVLPFSSYPSAPPQPEELVLGAHCFQSCSGPTLQLHYTQKSLSLVLMASRAAVVLPFSSTTARGACPWCSLPPELQWSYPSAPPQPEELLFDAHRLQSCCGPTPGDRLHQSTETRRLFASVLGDQETVYTSSEALSVPTTAQTESAPERSGH